MTEEFIYQGKDLEAMSFAKNYHNLIFTLIKDYLGKDIIEIGSGTGNFTEIINKNLKDSNIYCFEPSKDMIKVARNKFINKSNIFLFNDFFENGKNLKLVDSICYINVLEHIENDRATILKSYEQLKVGGYLIIFVPALELLYSNFDKLIGHYRRYNKKTLRKLFINLNIDIIYFNYFDLFGVFAWYINCKLLKRSLSNYNVSIFDNIIVPIIKFFPKNMKIPFGKNLILIAKKN